MFRFYNGWMVQLLRASCLCWHLGFSWVAFFFVLTTIHSSCDRHSLISIDASREKQPCASYSSCTVCATNANSPQDLAIKNHQYLWRCIGECPMLSSFLTVKAVCEACCQLQTVTMAPARVLLEWILSQSRIQKKNKQHLKRPFPATMSLWTPWDLLGQVCSKWEMLCAFFSGKKTTFWKTYHLGTSFLEKGRATSPPSQNHNLVKWTQSGSVQGRISVTTRDSYRFSRESV